MSTINLEKMKTFGAGGTIVPVIPFDTAKDLPTLELLMKYLPNYSFFKEFFGEKIIMDTIARGFGFNIFAQVETVDENMARCYAKHGYVLEKDYMTRYTKTMMNGEWRKDVDEMGYTFWIPNKYNQHAPFVKELFFVKYPWFSQFRDRVFIYDVGRNTDYIFLNMDDKKKGSFYILLEHLKNLDVQKLIREHMDYQKRYYRWPGGWCRGVTEEEVVKWRNEHNSAAWDPITLKFLEYVELERLYKANGKTEPVYY